MPSPSTRIDLSAAPGAWRLYTAAPDDDLRDVVVEYWEVEGELEAFRETLLPNGCVEVMINLGPPHDVLSAGGRGRWERGWFSGLHERALIIESRDGTHLVSARLHPVGAAALFGKPAADAANDIVDLDVFLGDDGRALRDAIASAPSPDDRFARLEDFMRRMLARGEPVPEHVQAAARAIDASHGTAKVASLHESLGVSRKHLAVSFDRHVGMSMKAYAKIRRFVWALAQLRERETISWSTLAIEAGYSDQSHLARDFRRIGAASPTEYVRRADPGGTALLYEAG